jgi:hypothetical protein
MADLWPQKSTRLQGEASLMPTIVDFPTIVKDAVDIFSSSNFELAGSLRLPIAPDLATVGLP